jgi:hypothetical protein
MKKTILAAIIALSGTIANNASAAPLYSSNTPIGYELGNIFLGFRASGGTGVGNSFLLNLGNYGTFPILNAGAAPVDLFDVGSELTTVFGADWKTRSQVTWGIFGMDPSRLPVYSSTADNRAAAPATKSSGQLGGAASAYAGMGANYNTSILNGASIEGSTGVLGDGVVTGTGASTWWKNINDAADFGIYNTSLEASVAGDLEFYSTSASKATRLTQFTISSGGMISVVPEPSTYALFGFGALLLIVAYRRKANA